MDITTKNKVTKLQLRKKSIDSLIKTEIQKYNSIFSNKLISHDLINQYSVVYYEYTVEINKIKNIKIDYQPYRSENRKIKFWDD